MGSNRSRQDRLVPWKVLKSRRLFSALPWVELSVERVRNSRGRVIDDFYHVQLPDYVTIIAVRKDLQIVMLRQYHHGARKVSLSFPAGYLEPGERPIEGARRELLEETGHGAESWRSVGRYVVDGNRRCGKLHLILAQGARELRKPKRDEMEELEAFPMTPSEIARSLRRGEIDILPNALAAAMIFFLSTDENKERLVMNGSVRRVRNDRLKIR